MANPQKENGYTAIANEIMDELISCEMSGQEFKIALLIIRKTYGFNKTDDAVSLSQMVAATGMGKIRCSQVVNRLQLMKILTVTENINGIGKKYKFNKDFETWETVEPLLKTLTVKKNINGIEIDKQKNKQIQEDNPPLMKTLTVNEKRNRPLMKTVTTKDTITKDNIQKTKKKDSVPFILPSWIPPEIWEAYLDVRNKKRAAKTDNALRLVVQELEKLQRTHKQDPVEILKKSIRSGWTDVYPLKPQDISNNGNQQFSPSTPIYRVAKCSKCGQVTAPHDITNGICIKCELGKT